MVAFAESLKKGDMSIDGALSALEATRLAGSIRNSLYLFPFLESLHVVGLTMVFGTIAVLDLRMLGIASTRRPVSGSFGVLASKSDTSAQRARHSSCSSLESRNSDFSLVSAMNDRIPIPVDETGPH